MCQLLDQPLTLFSFRFLWVSPIERIKDGIAMFEYQTGAKLGSTPIHKRYVSAGV
jgi:hypothetical protein